MNDDNKINTGNDSDDYHKETSFDFWLLERTGMKGSDLKYLEFDYMDMMEAYKAGVKWGVDHYKALTSE